MSIVVPAFNEEAVILDSVASLLGQRYPVFEIVIVDDGSTDATAAQDDRGARPASGRAGAAEPAPVRAGRASSTAAALRIDITLVRKDNGGRADALNAGLDLARHPYVCVTDADSILDPDGLTVMMRPVQEDPERVIAVGGTVRVAQLVPRRVRPRRGAAHAGRAAGRLPGRRVPAARSCTAASPGTAIGALFIVSGAFGLFRRDVVEEVGGYWVDTVGEDLELTVRLHRHMRDHRPPVPDHVRARPGVLDRGAGGHGARSEASGAAGTAACGSACGGTAR